MVDTSAVDVLPMEIISTIFECGCMLRPCDSIPFEILIAQIALATPNLWTRIHIIFPARHMPEITAQYLLRSGTLPLDLSIVLHGIHLMESQSGHDMQQTGQVLATHINRWREMRVSYGLHQALLDFMKLLPSAPATLLETIQIQCTETSSHPQLDITSLFNPSAPALRTIRLSSVGPPNSLPGLLSVTHLQLQDRTLCYWGRCGVAYTKLLSEMPCLTHLTLRGYSLIGGWPTPSVPFTLHSLAHLEIRFDPQRSGENVIQILSEMTAPRLESLLLKNITNDDLSHLSSPSTANTFSFPMLQALTLLTPGWFNNETPHLLSTAFPLITHFTYKGNDLDVFLRTNVWPRLHAITFLRNHISPVLHVAAIKQRLRHRPFARLELPKGLLTPPELAVLREFLDVEELVTDTHADSVEWPDLFY